MSDLSFPGINIRGCTHIHLNGAFPLNCPLTMGDLIHLLWQVLEKTHRVRLGERKHVPPVCQQVTVDHIIIRHDRLDIHLILVGKHHRTGIGHIETPWRRKQPSVQRDHHTLHMGRA